MPAPPAVQRKSVRRTVVAIGAIGPLALRAIGPLALRAIGPLALRAIGPLALLWGLLRRLLLRLTAGDERRQPFNVFLAGRR